MRTDPDHDPHDLPSADDPSLSLEESFDKLTIAVERITAQMDHIRQTLTAFYKAKLSISAAMPVLVLTEQLDPSLKTWRPRKDADEILTPDASPF